MRRVGGQFNGWSSHQGGQLELRPVPVVAAANSCGKHSPDSVFVTPPMHIAQRQWPPESTRLPRFGVERANVRGTRRPRRRSSPRSQERRAWRLRHVLLLAGGLSVLAATGALVAWLLYLDWRITSVFEGHRWTQPALVVAQPLELYAGLPMSADDFVVELERLGYRAVDSVDGAGRYARRGDTITLFPRPGGGSNTAAVPRGVFRVQFSGPRVLHVNAPGIADADAASVLQLEPLAIGSVFASSGEDRIVIAPEATPSLLVAALKVVEDRNFDSHVGIDPVAIVRAIVADVRAGELVQGGSTLTQQLVRSYFLSRDRTVTRKVNEVAMSVLLELRYEKTDLLNAYVNEIFLGQDGNRAIHGFALGSQFYLGKPLQELESHEIALLLAVIRGPSYYNPYRHPDRARARRDRILAQMAEFGVISQREHEQAAALPLALARNDARRGAWYPAFMDLVREQLARDYDAVALADTGLRVQTTLDARRQALAERALQTTLDRIEKARKLPVGELEGAVVITRAQTGDVLALVGGRQPGAAGFNHALRARRPIGSLVKPVVFLSAFEAGTHNLSTMLTDAPLPAATRWAPQNYDGVPRGPVPAVRALAESLNLATARLGLALGPDRVAQRIGDLTGSEPPQPLPSLLLGAVEMSPLTVATLYSAFHNGGFRTPPRAVAAVTDSSGQALTRYAIEVQQVAATAAIAQVDSGLHAVMAHGTGARSPFAGRGIAGKTGTSDSGRDSWFVGFDNDILVVVWVGYGDNRASALSGSTAALQVFDALMAELGTSGFDLPAEADVESVAIDFVSGGRVLPGCGDRPVRVLLPIGAAVAAAPGCAHVVPMDGAAIGRVADDVGDAMGDAVGDVIDRFRELLQ